MSRLYNDYGSIVRDRAEAKLNSINFFESHKRPSKDPIAAETYELKEQRLGAELLRLAQYERECVAAATEKLDRDLRLTLGKAQRKADEVLLFTGVVKLYADIYVAKVLSNLVSKGK